MAHHEIFIFLHQHFISKDPADVSRMQHFRAYWAGNAHSSLSYLNSEIYLQAGNTRAMMASKEGEEAFIWQELHTQRTLNTCLYSGRIDGFWLRTDSIRNLVIWSEWIRAFCTCLWRFLLWDPFLSLWTREMLVLEVTKGTTYRKPWILINWRWWWRSGSHCSRTVNHGQPSKETMILQTQLRNYLEVTQFIGLSNCINGITFCCFAGIVIHIMTGCHTPWN